MVYKIILEKKAVKFLENIPQSEKLKIIEEIKSLSENPRKQGVIKLKDSDPSQYRTRQGNYRIVFEIKDDVLIVLVIRIFIRGDEY
ncbi:MAG: type II toxin-antitoxin system RelE/ParE family toxin [Parachlamydiaceae bacterium]|nr:type II toxin-antitoxin system RelE/ParE family toxin [Parachlamydiaceae bacterium]